ncbi:MAG: hypothetical protein ACI9SE_000406 [Neolewinella sp.]|jgi:hypothetical protein
MLRYHTLLSGRSCWSLLAACSLGVLLATNVTAQSAIGDAPIDFDRDIRPILSNHCFQCHGPDGEHRKGGLRLDLKDDAFGKRDGVAAIVAGDVDASALVHRILSDDADELMPPAEANKPLSNVQQQLLVRWIEQGANWTEHWSFVAPVEPKQPKVSDAAWSRDAIDRFVLAKLDREGLQPNERADRRTLLRRVTLDLTGMPPTMKELQAFLSDTSPNAYERAVDRLLATDAYGEHMARFWLDAARYGDTHGLHLDNYREMWPYRDWVVRAFRDNLPFDRFITEQLAGDLLPEPTEDQLIASGFNRCHISTNEGGSIKEEVYVRNVIDRVSTTGTVFLGLTVGCAVCHDHKFDPISQQEFYQLFAFFNNLDGSPMDGNNKAHAPVMKIASDENTAALAKLSSDAKAVEGRVAAALAKIEYVEPAAAKGTAANLRKRRELVWLDDDLPAGAAIDGDGLVWVEDAPFVHSGKRAMKRQSQGNQQHYFRDADQKLRVASGDALFAWVYLDPTDTPEEIMLQWNSDGANGWLHRAYWGANKINYGKDKSAERWHMGALPKAGEWVRLEVPVATVGLTAGMAVHGVAFTQFGGTSYWDRVGIDTSSSQEPEDYFWVDDEVPEGAKPEGDGRKWQWVDGKGKRQPKPFLGARSLRRKGKGLSQDFFTEVPVPLKLHQGDRLFAHVWLDPKDPPSSVQLQFHAKGSWDHRSRWGGGAHGEGRPNGADFRAGDAPKTGEWVRIEVVIADVGLAAGDVIDGWAFTKVDGTVYWDGAGVHTFAPPNDAHLTSLAAWQETANGNAALPEALRKTLAVPMASRSKEQQASVRDHYLRHVHGKSRVIFAPMLAEFDAIAKQRTAVEAKIPTTLVMKERAEMKDAFVLQRGLYDQKGDKVVRATPAALPPMADDLSRDRLGLAKWLTAAEQPLTARVTVNRFWQQLFGTGIVKTSEDFGNQGERPSHPALLDYLATRFVSNGWNVKGLMKQMVLTSTYQQAPNVHADALRLDPENRWLSRGPRFRLDGEVLRDQALLLSGLLVQKIGGPGVRPPQPGGLWKAVGYSSSNTARFMADKGHEKVHRRSLYTFWKRTSPPPQMTTFDAPSREECRVRRERTNTPMQALLLMNDPQYVEAARCFAERILQEGGKSDASRVAWALESATCQVPSAADIKEVRVLLKSERAAFALDPAAAKQLIAIGAATSDADCPPVELAAWTMAANLILNLDAVLTKG